MKRAIALLVATLVIGVVPVAVLAHEQTFKGTVASVEPGSKAVKIKVTVVDQETKKTVTMPFDIDDQTKVLRGDVLIKFSELKIEKGEQISVTINHDEDETLAQVVRLPAKKG